MTYKSVNSETLDHLIIWCDDVPAIFIKTRFALPGRTALLCQILLSNKADLPSSASAATQAELPLAMGKSPSNVTDAVIHERVGFVSSKHTFGCRVALLHFQAVLSLKPS